jgi:hypothetical protein
MGLGMTDIATADIQPPVATKPARRMRLLFFRESARSPWWRHFLKPGFRHVTACSYYATEDRWIVFDPASCGTAVEVYLPDEFGAVLAALLESATVAVRFPSEHARRRAPVCGWCAAAVVGLLGVRTAAITPYQLYRALLARGAEVAWPDPSLATAPAPEVAPDHRNVVSFKRAAAAVKAGRRTARI